MTTLHSHGSEPSAPRRGVRGYVALSSAVAALGGLLFGYDTGVVSGALLFFKNDFGGLSSFQQELVTSLLLVGAVVGALCAGRVADQVGRKKAVLVTAAIFVVGVLLAAFTWSYAVLLVARVIIGVAVGSASMVVPLYVGEIVPPRLRGGFVSFNQLAVTVGIVVSYLVDYGLSSSQNWRLMFGLAVIPAVLLFIGMLLQQESPHWLVTRGRESEERAVLTLLTAIGGVGTFFLFAFLTVVAFLYFWHTVPETKRRSPQQIERDFALERGAPVGASAAGR